MDKELLDILNNARNAGADEGQLQVIVDSYNQKKKNAASSPNSSPISSNVLTKPVPATSQSQEKSDNLSVNNNGELQANDKVDFTNPLNNLPKANTGATITTPDGVPFNIIHPQFINDQQALQGLQQRVNTRTATDDDAKFLAANTGKSVDATMAYLHQGKDAGSAVEVNDNVAKSNGVIIDGINTLGSITGFQFHPEEILNSADKSARALQAIKQIQQEEIDRQTKNVNERNAIINSPGYFNRTGVPTVTPIDPKILEQSKNLQDALTSNVRKLTADEAIKNGMSPEEMGDLLYQRLDPDGYAKNQQLRKQATTSTAQKIGSSILSLPHLVGNIAGWLNNSDELNKETLNAEKSQYQLEANQGMRDLAIEKKAQGIANNDQALIQEANNIIPNIKDDNQIIESSPMLMKQQMAQYINQRYAQEAGILNGTEPQGLNGRVLNFAGINSDVAKRYLKEGGYYDKANFKDYADDVATHQNTYLADNSAFGGVGLSFLKPFVSLFNTVGDLEGVRNESDIHREATMEEMFPKKLTENVKNDLSFNLLGHQFDMNVSNTINSVANLGGYAAIAAATGGASTGAGLSAGTAERAGAWASFGMGAVDDGLKEADKMGLTPAQSWLYAGLKGVMFAEGGRLLEFGKTSIPPIQGVNEALAKAAIRISDKTLAEDGAKEALNGAANSWLQGLAKYGIGTAKGAAVMSGFGVGDSMLKLAFGDKNTKPEDILPEAASAYFNGLFTMGLFGAAGVGKEIDNAKNSTYKGMLSKMVDNHDATEDVLKIGLGKGYYLQPEYDQKLSILNIGIKAKATLNDAIARNGFKLSPEQKAAWVANKTIEQSLRNEATREGVSEADAKKYNSQADNLNEQNSKILDGLTFNKFLEPQEELYSANTELKQAQSDFADNPTPENEQAVLDKKAAVDNVINPPKENTENATASDTAPLIQKAIDLLPKNNPALAGFESDADKVKFIAQQAQNISENGEPLSGNARPSIERNFGEELVDAAIEAYPKDKLLNDVNRISNEDYESKKADIEFRRKQELNDVFDKNLRYSAQENKPKYEAVNAKYDKELADLEKSKTPITTKEENAPLNNVSPIKELPDVGDIVDFGEGKEKVTRIVDTSKGKMIEAVNQENGSDRRNLYMPEDYKKSFENADKYEKLRQDRIESKKSHDKYLLDKQAKEDADKREYDNSYGFADSETALQKGKILTYLNKDFNRGHGTVKDYLKSLVLNKEAHIRDFNGKPTIMYNDGSHELIANKDYQTKISREYLSHLQSLPKETLETTTQEKQTPIVDEKNNVSSVEEGANELSSLEKIPFDKRTDAQHASFIKQKFVKEFTDKGVPKEQVDAATALLDARAKIANPDNPDAYYRKIQDIGKGEFQDQTPRLYQMPDGSKVMGVATNPEVVNGFYSPIEKRIAEFKGNNASATKWKEIVGKKEEAKWTGVAEWLDTFKPNEQISKEQILQHMRDNRIQIVEVVKGKGESDNLVGKNIGGFEIRRNEQGGYDTYRNGKLIDEDADSERSAASFIKQNYDLPDHIYQQFSKYGEIDNTKFSQYQLAGEKENYKEVLITMPNDTKSYYDLRKQISDYRAQKVPRKSGEDIVAYQDRYKKELANDKAYQDLSQRMQKADASQKEDFKSSHFDEPNILAHVRMSTRIDAEGNKVLFVDEIQSDWGQKGKREGFAEPNEKLVIKKTERGYWEVSTEKGDFITNVMPFDAKNEAEALIVARDRIKNNYANSQKRVASAPFVTDTNQWTKLGLKYALRHAVEEGDKKIVWTTGEQQNERYDLSKQVHRIDVEKVDNVPNLFFVDIVLPNGETHYIEVENGKVRNDKSIYSGQKLEDLVGKDIAEKILNGGTQTLQGDGLKVGGKGMKGFYGQPSEGKEGIVGNVAKALVKDLTGKEGKIVDTEMVETKGATKFGTQTTTQHSIEITPELKAAVNKGMPLFQKGAEGKPKGAVETLANGRKIIHALDAPDFTTAVHEIAHVFEDELSPEERKVITDFSRQKEWNTATSEAFARGFEKYLKEGNAPTPELKNIFQKAKEWITEIYNKLKQGSIKLTPEVRKVFDNLFKEKSEPTPITETPKEQPEQNFKQFADIAKNSSSADEAFNAVQKIKYVPAEVSAAFREKYDPENKLTPKQAFEKFYNEQNQSETQKIEPPIEPPTGNTGNVGSGEGNTSGITHAATEETRSKLGVPEYEKTTKTDEELNAEADKQIKAGYDAEKLIKKIEGGHQPTDVENTILKKYKAVLEAKVEKDPSDKNIADLYRLVKASDAIGSEQGRALRSRQGLDLVDDSLGGYFVREMDALNVDELTPEQKADIQKEYEDIKKANDDLRQKVADLEAKQSEKNAEAKIKIAKPKSTSAKKTHADFEKERSQIITHLKEQLKKARSETSAVAVPYAKELFYVAPDVARLVKSLVDEGITKLADVVENVHGILKESIPQITKKDVHDIIAGEYNKKPQTKNEITASLRDLRDEAKLVNKLNSLLEGNEPLTQRLKVERNQQIKDLREKIKAIQKQNKDENKFYGEEMLSDAKKLRAVKNGIERQIKELQDDLSKGNFSKEEPKKSILEDKELQKKYPELYKQTLDAKDKLIKLKTEREIRILKEQYANRSKIQKTKDVLTNVLNTPRTIMASVDYSAPLRQGIIASISHPVTASKAFVEMFRQSFSQKRFDRWHYDLEQSPEFKLMEQSGLYVANPHNPILTAKEEQFMNNLAEKIPFIGRAIKIPFTDKRVGGLIKGSERAYTAYLNKLRVDLFTNSISAFSDDGKTFENSPELYKGMASFINNATGRGNLGKLEGSAQTLNTLFFSPRLIAARLNMLNPVYYGKLPKEIRIKALLSMAKFIGVGLSVLALADLNDAKVEKDPRSTDFGKIKIGQTRWDVWGGFQQYVRFMGQMLSGQKKSTKTGKIEVMGKRYGSATRFDNLVSFARGKLSPVPAEVASILAGKNSIGQPLTLSNEAQNLLEPLLFQDIQDAYKTQGAKSIITIGLPSVFGVGVQTQVPFKKSKN